MIAAPPPKPRRPAPDEPPAVMRSATLLASFRHAFDGLGYMLRTQRNAKIHSTLGLVAVTLGLVLGISRAEWLALVLVIALVLMAEGINTAVEAAVDLVSPAYHPLAKVAKDVAAGTVLLVAIAALAVGLIVFLPYLFALVRAWF